MHHARPVLTLPLTLGLSLVALLALAACVQEGEEDPAMEEDPAVIEVEGPEPVSILRPDEGEDAEPEVPLQRLEVTIGFPGGGAELDEAAIEKLEGTLDYRQMQEGGAIAVGAHSDSAGSDRANADAAEARGLAVAVWLIENGVDPARINVIVFGEQNPVQPNALPDGSPNEEGRALNRRVELTFYPLVSDDIPTLSAPGSETSD